MYAIVYTYIFIYVYIFTYIDLYVIIYRGLRVTILDWMSVIQMASGQKDILKFDYCY